MPLSCRGLGDLWVREPQTLRHRIGSKVCGITGVLILKASGIGTWCPQMSQIIFVAYRYKLPTIEWQSKTCLSSIVGLVDVYNDACTISWIVKVYRPSYIGWIARYELVEDCV